MRQRSMSRRVSRYKQKHRVNLRVPIVALLTTGVRPAVSRMLSNRLPIATVAPAHSVSCKVTQLR